MPAFTQFHYHWTIVHSPITDRKIGTPPPPLEIWKICTKSRLKGRKTHCPQLSPLTPKKPCSMLHSKTLCHRAKSSGQFTFYRQQELFAGRISLVIRLEYSNHVLCVNQILSFSMVFEILRAMVINGFELNYGLELPLHKNIF